MKEILKAVSSRCDQIVHCCTRTKEARAHNWCWPRNAEHQPMKQNARNAAQHNAEQPMLEQNARNAAPIGGNQAGAGSCHWECQVVPKQPLPTQPDAKLSDSRYQVQSTQCQILGNKYQGSKHQVQEKLLTASCEAATGTNMQWSPTDQLQTALQQPKLWPRNGGLLWDASS